MSDNKMTPLPWEIDEIEDEIHIVRVGGFPASVCALYSGPMDDETRANAAAIVSAVNSTWGSGINPEAVPELVEALKEMLRFEHVMKEGGAERLQYPDNFLNAIESAKAAIEKATIK